MTWLWIWAVMVGIGILAVAGVASRLKNGGPPEDDFGEDGTGKATREGSGLEVDQGEDRDD